MFNVGFSKLNSRGPIFHARNDLLRIEGYEIIVVDILGLQMLEYLMDNASIFM